MKNSNQILHGDRSSQEIFVMLVPRRYVIGHVQLTTRNTPDPDVLPYVIWSRYLKPHVRQ